MTDCQRRQLRRAYWAPFGVYIMTVLWQRYVTGLSSGVATGSGEGLQVLLPWVALFIWYLFAWYRAKEVVIKQGYKYLLQSLGGGFGFYMLAKGAFIMTEKFQHGGMDDPRFGYLLLFMLLGGILLLIGAIWPVIHIVRSYQKIFK